MARAHFIQSKIEQIATDAGVRQGSLESILAALPRRERRRVRLFLQGVHAQSAEPDIQNTANQFLLTAERIWALNRAAD